MEFLKTIAKAILKEEIENYKIEIALLDELNNSKEVDSEIKEYYDSKYQTNNISYSRTDQETIKIDVRNFIQPNDFNLPTITGTDDEIAFDSLLWIIKNITYTPDKTEYGLDEYWAFPYQTLNNKKGDCEDGAILLASIMIKNGIPNWKVRVSAGSVDDGNISGGHAFVTYYCQDEDKWVLLDWCYWKNLTIIKDRVDYKEEEYYKDVWFSFNNEYSWAKDAKDIEKFENIK